MWRHFPPALLAKQILVPGGAFRMDYQFPEDLRPKRRWFFVLNRAPADDDKLMVATSTTQVAKRRACRPGNVLVDISPRDYKDLPDPSLIDCSSIEAWPKEEFIARLARKEVQPLAPLPLAVMSRICKAVACCSTLEPYKKRMILGPG